MSTATTVRPLATKARGAGVRKCRGGGFLKDPSYGVADGADTIGFDCSTLMAYAFYNGSDNWQVTAMGQKR